METNKPTLLFPPCIDSTILASFRSCPQKAFRTYVEHWKPQYESVHLIAGGAFAKGLEVARTAFYIEGKKAEESEALGAIALIKEWGDFEPPEGIAKTLERTLGAFAFYFEHYPLGRDTAIPIEKGGQNGIEFSFAIPLPINNPSTGEPLLYTGRADMIAHFAGGTYVFDDKTTSSLGATWSKQWEMRAQFTGYIWACRELLGFEPAGAIVRGVSILKTKYETQEALTTRTSFEIDRWYQQTLRDIERMIVCWREGYWDFSLDNACAEYGGCSLQRVCKSPTPYDMLPLYFRQRVWDSAEHTEISVADWESRWR